MKRTILLLATAFLGTTGCFSRHAACDSILTLYWNFPAGQTCAQAGVSYVRVLIDGQAQVDASGNANFACAQASDQPGVLVQGIRFFDFADRTYQLEVDGYDGAGTLSYLAQQSFVGASCGEQVVDANLTAVTGTMTVYTSFGAATTCAAAGVTSIYYALLDGNGNPFSTGNVACVDPTPGIQLPGVPFGPYTFRFIQGLDAAGFARFQKCGEPVNFVSEAPLAVPLPPATGAVCP